MENLNKLFKENSQNNVDLVETLQQIGDVVDLKGGKRAFICHPMFHSEIIDLIELYYDYNDTFPVIIHRKDGWNKWEIKSYGEKLFELDYDEILENSNCPRCEFTDIIFCKNNLEDFLDIYDVDKKTKEIFLKNIKYLFEKYIDKDKDKDKCLVVCIRDILEYMQQGNDNIETYAGYPAIWDVLQYRNLSGYNYDTHHYENALLF
ncbi:MAG: hypothetical protein ACI35S_03625 [Anaeroplasma sp.]